MDDQGKKKRIIWAMDALETPGMLQSNALNTLKELSEAVSCEIEPVYVMSSAPEIAVEYSFQWASQFRGSALAAVKRIVRKYPLSNMLPPRVIEQTGSSTLGAAENLAAYAANHHASMIIANTHSKTGLKRFFLGSFAETLILRSRVPVIVVGPHIPKPKPIRKILHPTDFTTQARFAFKEVIDLAGDLKAEITLLHVIPFSLRPYTSANILFPGSYWGLYQDYLRAALLEADRSAEAWKKIAENNGVKLESVIDRMDRMDRRGKGIWESIIEFAKTKRVQLIAMESQTGPMTSAIMGSITRQVLRHAPCPVWTLHPRARRVKKARPVGIRSGPRTKITQRAA